MIPSKPVIFSYNQVEVPSRVSSDPQVQISRSSARYSAGNRGSVQVESSPVQSRRPLGFGQVLSDQPAASCLEHLQVPVIFKGSVVAGSRTIWVLVQIHEFRSVEVLLDTPPGSPKNCPGAKGVYSRRPLGFGQVLSDQPAASRLEHCRSPGCDVDTAGPMPYRLDDEYRLILS
ncbi:hypothetical protein F2Q69_00042580 [Brassica cretica]|uniref:Uncharacterized protein n=1 Tax=Brassica cretica TaxID=69181 RepID=A0A8S9NLQ2_BRACR|nr:hypothetical protein F2Q69_00042580 [Brassica cretica]